MSTFWRDAVPGVRARVLRTVPLPPTASGEDAAPCRPDRWSGCQATGLAYT